MSHLYNKLETKFKKIRRMKNYKFIKYLSILLLGLAVFSQSCKKDDEKEYEAPKEKLEIGQSYQGGIIGYVDWISGQHGIIVAPSDEAGYYTWEEAKTVCKNKILEGYSDWYLPSFGEMYNLNIWYTLEAESEDRYWSSSDNWHNSQWSFEAISTSAADTCCYAYFMPLFGVPYFGEVYKHEFLKTNRYKVRAVRAF